MCASTWSVCVEQEREYVCVSILDKVASGPTGKKKKRTNGAKRRLGEFGEFGSWFLFGSR